MRSVALGDECSIGVSPWNSRPSIRPPPRTARIIGQARAIACRPSRSSCARWAASTSIGLSRRSRSVAKPAAQARLPPEKGARMKRERLVRAVRFQPEIAAGDHGAQRHQAATQRLGQGQHGGLDPLALDGKDRPRPPQAGLHFVSDEECHPPRSSEPCPVFGTGYSWRGRSARDDNARNWDELVYRSEVRQFRRTIPQLLRNIEPHLGLPE